MPPTTHARLGASSAHRWMKCAGAPRLESQMPDTTSVYAIEGSAAHAVAESCLRNGTDPNDSVGGYIAVGGTDEAVLVTQEMADAVSVFVQYVRSLMAAPGAKYEFELRVSLADLKPPQPMYGTADAVVWQPEASGGTLIVADFKYGQGVLVEAENNPQLMYYALGAVLSFRVRPSQIVLAVVQPRAEHEDGPVRTATISWDDLVAFRRELMDAARAATEPDAPVGPVGDHCKFCRAKAICPAQRSTAVAVAQSEFDALPAAGPPPPEALTQDQLVEVLSKAHYIEDWLASVREYAKRQLEQGKEVPGWKLVAKRATRRWADEAAAEAFLRKKYRVADIFRKTLISPAQAEKLGAVPAELIVAKSSGYNLAPESNPRPAITPGADAVDEFSTN